MNQITVTMPMSEYESTNELIERLHKTSIDRFIKKEYLSLETGEYTLSLDLEMLNRYLDKKYPDRQKTKYRIAKLSSYTYGIDYAKDYAKPE